ncbi:UDP-glucose 4-epimerase GalE [Effusibacillus consociatus]|uniref:UDP-glucose 4-epimerase n=1 Tax=Effusibacillus consociatus TaxID=1117041 RepID=A0ABV9Q807_9BACL
MSCVLVTGGAGYIGSHTVKVLLKRGYEAVVLDNLSTGHRQAVLVDEAHFYQGDIADDELVTSIVEKHGVDSVIHFAAKSLVGESMKHPEMYLWDNTAKSVRFFTTLKECGVRNIIFSSTAAVYGLPEQIPIPEYLEKKPVNPYGESKLMVEKALQWMEQAHGIKWVALRYFNAAGAELTGVIGEDHNPETHLIPLVLQTALGKREAIQVFGTDYDTPDGTCIRDYIHVLDLTDAHILALEALKKGMSSGALNVGTGNGYSVREVIEMAKEVTEREIPVVETERRPGDPAVLVADSTLAQQLLGWKPQFTLREMIASAWKWHSTHPEGYRR